MLPGLPAAEALTLAGTPERHHGTTGRPEDVFVLSFPHPLPRNFGEGVRGVGRGGPACLEISNPVAEYEAAEKPRKDAGIARGPEEAGTWQPTPLELAPQ